MQTIDIMEYVNTQTMLAYNAPTVLIEPEISGVGTLDFIEAKRLVDEGYAACERSGQEIVRKIKIWV
jgi:predicted acylesterase/phospholipase RssA